MSHILPRDLCTRHLVMKTKNMENVPRVPPHIYIDVYRGPLGVKDLMI